MAIDKSNAALIEEVSSKEESERDSLIKNYKKLEAQCDEIIKKIKVKKFSIVK